jgi:hypothetical protein
VVGFTLRPLNPRGKSPRYPLIGGWVGPRAGLDGVEKRKFLTLPGLELRPFSRPARSQTLCRLHYPGSLQFFGSRTKLIHLKSDIIDIWSFDETFQSAECLSVVCLSRRDMLFFSFSKLFNYAFSVLKLCDVR